MIDRKEFGKKKKLMEEKVKLKLISKYPHIHQLYETGELTLKQAYDGAQSEMLGVETFKSKGTKKFITHSTKIKNSKSESPYPYSKHPLIESSVFNCEYEELLKMDFKRFKNFSLDLRKELLRVWNEEGIPPTIGKNRNEIIQDFKKLKEQKISSLYLDGDSAYEFVLHNNYRFGSSCNQFTSALQKTKIDGKSLYDILSNKEYELKWMRILTRNLKQDYSYEFSKRILNENELEKWKNEGWSFLPQKKSPIDNIIYSKKDLKKLVKDGFLKQYHIENLGVLFDSETEFNIRRYKSSTKIFSHIIHLIRIGFSNTPTNFNPLVARTIYEKFLDEKSSHTVYDSSVGWGGRFLGAMISNRKIKYLGVDVNSNLFSPHNTFDSISNFLDSELGIKSDYSIKKMSSVNYRETEEYKKYKGKCSMILTSPPYFAKEEYSEDSEQSYLHFSNYRDWLGTFLFNTFKIAFEMIKEDGYCLVNISDVSIKNKNFELELDTINVLEKIGWKYQFQIGMKMNRFIGLSTENIVNRVYDENKETYIKVEPVLVFKKE